LRKTIFLYLFAILLFSCKSPGTVLTKKTNKLSSKKLIKRINKNAFDASTFESRFNIKYKDENQNFNGNGKIRILKDSIIWGSINFMGIPMVKFYLTPTQIKYYNKIEKKYYTGDYHKIKDLIGTELNFKHLQDLLLGNSLNSNQLKKYTLHVLPQIYRFENEKNLLTQVDFNPNYKVISEKIHTPEGELLIIRYNDFITAKRNLLPRKIHILHKGKGQNLSLDIYYKNISINKDLKFPFSIPSNYSKIDF
jgi:hypothetical protein